MEYDLPVDPVHDVAAIIRLSDGKTVQTLPARQPAVVSGDALTTVEDGKWTVSDAATGAATSQVDVSNLNVIAQTATWVLAEPSQRQSGTQYLALEVVRPDGSVTPVAGPNSGYFPTNGEIDAVGSDGNTAYVDINWDVYSIDLTTGAVSVLPSFAPGATVAAAPRRVYGWQSSLDSLNVSWVNSADASTGSITVDGDYGHRDLIPYAGGLLALDQVSAPGELQPVDLTTGALGAPIATGVVSAHATPDGSVVLLTSAGAHGRIDLITADDPATVRPMYDLPPGQVPADYISLSGNQVYATWADSDAVRVTNTAGSTTWSAFTPATSVPSRGVGPEFSQAGNVVMTAQAPADYSDTYPHTLTWPGGSRQIEAEWDVVALGHGGRYVSLEKATNDGDEIDVESVTSGKLAYSYPYWPDLDVVDGNWLWRQPTNTGELTGIDLTDPASTNTIPLTACDGTNASLTDVRGRWALVECGTGSEWIVDLTQSQPAWQVPVAGGTLGGDFYAWVATDSGASGQSLHVSDFLGDEHEYGTLSSTSPPGVSYAPNDDGSHSMTYVDGGQRPHYVDLSWVQVPAGPPATPPTPLTLGQANGSASVVRALSATVTYRYGATPAAAVSSYDVQVRHAGANGAFTSWSAKATGTTATSQVQHAAAGTTWCLRFRAHNSSGAVTPWSSQRCTTVPEDDTALAHTTAPRHLKASWAIGGSYSVYRKAKAHITLARGGARSLQMWVVRTKGGGAVDVYVGSRRLKTVNLASRKTEDGAVVVGVPVGASGPISLVSRSTAPVGIDAVAVFPSGS